jgi:myo-inositol 2-dehydrogenase / D-chiro-inositol 1-dehydrogenase
MRIGWIGCGRHAEEMLLPQLTRLPITLAAICDANAERLALIGNRYGVSARYTDAEALLAHEGLDAIGMAVGPGVHASIGAQAMERGLAVFMEKPPAATAADAQRLAEVAARTGRPCVVGFMKRYSTANRMAFNLLSAPAFGPRAGLLGEYMTAPGYFVGNPDYTGFLLHHCVHAMDLVPWLMGEPVTDVTARRFEMAPGKLLLHVGFGFASGALATVVHTPIPRHADGMVAGDGRSSARRNPQRSRGPLLPLPRLQSERPGRHARPHPGRAGLGAQPHRRRQ